MAVTPEKVVEKMVKTIQDVLETAAWAKIYAYMRAHNDSASLTELTAIGIPSIKDSGKLLSESGISKFVKMLKQNGFVSKKGRRYCLTNSILDLYALHNIQLRMDEDDLFSIGRSREMLGWGIYSQLKESKAQMESAGETLSSIIIDESIRAAIFNFKQELLSILYDSKLNIMVKADALKHSKSIMGTELEQSHVPEHKIEEMGLLEFINDLRERDGINVINDPVLKKEIREALKRLEKNAQFGHRNEIKRKEAHERLDATLRPLRFPALFIMATPMIYNDEPIAKKKGKGHPNELRPVDPGYIWDEEERYWYWSSKKK
jgi:hypothetical protein